MSTTTAPFTLKVQRNEVPVRVVVRDREGRAVRGLTKDDFRILDEGKPQAITRFSTEGTVQAPVSPTANAAAGITPPAASKMAERFVALYFDDLVMKFEEFARVRPAAAKYLETSLQPGDRVGIFTSSGRGDVDFTADRNKLLQDIAHIGPQYIFSHAGEDCPDLSDYEAYLVDEANDQQALAIATAQVAQCDPGERMPDLRAKMAARMRWDAAQRQEAASLGGLQTLVRRLSIMPGPRSIVFVSRGFFSGRKLALISEIIDSAVRAGVVVNSLDARGLYTLIPGGDASQRGSGLTGLMGAQLIQMQNSAASQNADVLSETAAGTGGVFFQNNNDMNAGFRTVGGLAEFYYVLVFSPKNLEPNGKYHHLKVSLEGAAAKSHLIVQARRGYFAPGTSARAGRNAEDEIVDAVFSRDQLNSSRLRLGTQFFKASPTEARLTIVTNLDSEGLNFRTENGRHVDQVTFVTVLFDTNGNVVQGVKRTVELNLRDTLFERTRAAGLSIASNFKVQPGSYLVREVVRDNGGMVSTANEALEIPY